MKNTLDQIRGSLFGGAAGDALGYAIEFHSELEIFGIYGMEGITEYTLAHGKALISDDTQMTLFTAAGLLMDEKNGPVGSVALAYRDWLKTQLMKKYRASEKGYTELFKETGLYSRRAPGLTCMSALESRWREAPMEQYTKNPINHSKGCGGIMRVAPVALRYRLNEDCGKTIEELDQLAAETSAVTHGHSLGFMPSSVVSHIISRILSTPEMSLKEIILEARDTVAKLFVGDKHLPELIDIINRAVTLAESEGTDDLDNIHALGEGWVAEETLGIALYCALRYQDDFSKAIIAAVNHNGDSDSTGAVTGNILGSLVGYEAMEQKWKENLELKEVILQMADALYGAK